MTVERKALGITAGVFDLCHTGHLMMFAEAKRYVDTLIVCVQVDPSQHRAGKNKPVETIYERYIRLMSCRNVDSIIPYETEEDLINIMKFIDYDYRFLSEEYKYKEYTARDIKPEKHFYNRRDHSYSSTDLRDRIIKDRISSILEPSKVQS